MRASICLLAALYLYGCGSSVRRLEGEGSSVSSSQQDAAANLVISGVEFMYVEEFAAQGGSERAVPGFLISKTEVTVAQYKRCVEANSCTEPNTQEGCNWGRTGREEHPVNCVDWEQARTYARWLGSEVDLPTSQEWEHAAQGGQPFQYAGSDDPGKVAWYDQNAGGSTHPVATKVANQYTLYDMSGNVWEWTLATGRPDEQGSRERFTKEDCKGRKLCEQELLKREIRGGSWDYEVDHLLVKGRSALQAELRAPSVGFRVRLREAK